MAGKSWAAAAEDPGEEGRALALELLVVMPMDVMSEQLQALAARAWTVSAARYEAVTFTPLPSP